MADLQSGLGAEAYEREVLALWSSESGAYFDPGEIEAAVADYELLSPDQARAASSWDYQAGGKSGSSRLLPGSTTGSARTRTWSR